MIEFFWALAVPLIGQAICIGDARPYNVALLVLDPDAAKAFAIQHGLDGCSVSALVNREWLPGGEELTPTMKLQRRPITTKYAGEIEALYR